MKAKPGRKYRNLFLAVFTLLFGCSYGMAQSLAVIKDGSPLREDTSHRTSTETDSIKPTSSYWHSFIWEAIPSDWLADSNKRTLLDAYQQNDWKPVFLDSRFELTRGARAFLDRIQKLEDEAIDSKPYKIEAIQKSINRLEQQRSALKSVDSKPRDVRAQFSDIPSFDSPTPPKPQPPPVQYAMDNAPVQAQQQDPTAQKEREQRYRDVFRAASEADIRMAGSLTRFAQEMHPASQDLQLKVLTGAITMEEFLKSLAPGEQYDTLVKTYARYRKLAAEGHQQRVNASGTIRMGDSGNTVRDLQKRLSQEEFYRGKITGHFDSETHDAVMKFQAAHLIDPDGSVGQRTRDALNLPFERKVKMLAQSIKAMRQSQTRLYDRFVRINIPQFMLEYYKDGKVRDAHRVIVGKASGKKVKLVGRIMGENHTPTLASTIEQVIVNPRWYVTDRIMRELSGEFSSDPNYFAKHGYVRMASLYPSGQPRMFQLPGPTNPLGRVKFEFSNAYAVFLHDTPKRQLFQRSRRDFSHGCVRVDKAQALAELIVSDDQNPAAQKMAHFLEENHPTHIRLNQPLPIVIEYVTVSANEHGQVIFNGDPYGWTLEDDNRKAS